MTLLPDFQQNLAWQTSLGNNLSFCDTTISSMSPYYSIPYSYFSLLVPSPLVKQ